MDRTLTRLWREAVRYAAATVKQIAEESGRKRVTFDKYLNERPPSWESVIALADALDARAERLIGYAKRLREAAGEHGSPAHAKAKTRGGRSTDRRRGR